jgi:hypothetical protein
MGTKAIVAFVVIIVAIVVAVIAILSAKIQRGEREDARLTSLFVPDPNNQTALVVRGWNRDELQKIITDFSHSYGITDTSGFHIDAKDGHTLEITFPSDIQPKLLMFLVNYVQYPKGFDLTHRSIGVVGHALLTPAFGAPDPKLNGRRATIYVPANYTEYDVVYVRLETGETYRVPFSDMGWQATDDERVPDTITGL